MTLQDVRIFCSFADCFNDMNRLQKSYFLQHDVVALARDLLGKYVFTMKEGQLAGGIIVETEAYRAVNDRASHAYGGRRTARNEMMYHEGGIAYVFLCYGIHNMLNFVTNEAEVPDAVLIRGIAPTHGMELMQLRTGKPVLPPNAGDGPGRVGKLLGITKADNGRSLTGDTIWLEDRGLVIPDNQVLVTPRIGIDYAGDDAKLPYRFVVHDFKLTTL